LLKLRNYTSFMLPDSQIEDFDEISGRFLKVLGYEGFNFVYIETNNIYQVSTALQDLVKMSYPDRKIVSLYVYKNSYRWLMDQITKLGQGIIFINDFEQLIQNPEIAVPLNQRRDKLAAMPISLVCFAEVGAMPKVARAIPDLWSFRNLVLTFRYITPLQKERLLNREQITAAFIDENTKKEKLELINQLNGKLNTLKDDLYDYPLKSRLLHELAGLYSYIQLIDQAIETEEKNLALARQFNSSDDAELARINYNIGNYYFQKADYDTAKIFFEQAFNFTDKTKESLLLADGFDGLELSYRELGNYEKSLELAIKANNIYEKILAKYHPELANSYNNLSIIYQDIGNLPQAMEFQLKAIDIREKVLSPDHPELATSYNNLAQIYLAMGNLPQSLEFQLKAKEIQEKVQDRNHPQMAACYNNLSLIYRAMGNLPQALEYSLKDISICEKVLSPNHPALAHSYNNLSLIFRNMGNLTQALEFQLKAIVINEKVLSPDHPDLATSYNNLCSIYYDLKEFEKANFYIGKAVEIHKKSLPKEHPSIQNALDWKKLVEGELGKKHHFPN